MSSSTPRRPRARAGLHRHHRYGRDVGHDHRVLVLFGRRAARAVGVEVERADHGRSDPIGNPNTARAPPATANGVNAGHRASSGRPEIRLEDGTPSRYASTHGPSPRVNSRSSISALTPPVVQTDVCGWFPTINMIPAPVISVTAAATVHRGACSCVLRRAKLSEDPRHTVIGHGEPCVDGVDPHGALCGFIETSECRTGRRSTRTRSNA